MDPYVIAFDHLGMNDVAEVGGKNASLGEMISQLSGLGVTVPGGFATTAHAYRDFLAQDGLADRIADALGALDIADVDALAATGARIRGWIRETPLPPRLTEEISAAWETMRDGRDIAVAVRSSATAEDLPEASFAGQQETYLNVMGLDNVIAAVHDVFASLFNDRAIAYREHQGFEHSHVALSAGVQYMVRSDIGASGVMFTLDTDSGFDKVVFITAAYGLGETVVQGAVNPDEFHVFKPSLKDNKSSIIRRTLGSKAIRMIYSDGGGGHTEATRTENVPEELRQAYCISDDEVAELARQAVTIEEHYAKPMDIEWGRDGEDGKLYILQARPETVQSRRTGGLHRFQLKGTSKIITRGRSIGHRIGSGPARVIKSVKEMNRVREGDVLVADMTDPDWEPIMKRASAIVTNRGGRTCHAAIIARELGIPAVVGCGDATTAIPDGNAVTISCAEGDTGFIYDGELDFEEQIIELDSMPDLPVKIMMNVGNPDRAMDFAGIPNKGIGLARIEFIVNRMIGVHPRALLDFDRLDEQLKMSIRQQMGASATPEDFYIDRLSEGVATIAASVWPQPVIVRMSDFKSNEYANLIGGRDYEPHEENPMLGFRGASRYVDETFRACFELECRALRKVRNEMGLTNVDVMVPFVRTVEEAKGVTELLAANGLARGDNGLRHIMMCEIPSNALLAERFLEHFDGMSIGSNDMTQLTLGLDRDSGIIAHLFDERDDAVKSLLHMAIQACRKQDKYIGICGQGPSDHADFARWLLDEGIESISLNPDTVVETWLFLAGQEV